MKAGILTQRPLPLSHTVLPRPFENRSARSVASHCCARPPRTARGDSSWTSSTERWKRSLFDRTEPRMVCRDEALDKHQSTILGRNGILEQKLMCEYCCMPKPHKGLSLFHRNHMLLTNPTIDWHSRFHGHPVIVAEAIPQPIFKSTSSFHTSTFDLSE